MKLMTCPVNGSRNISEFQYFGPVRDTSVDVPENLTEHLFLFPNPIGILQEWWRHTPSNTIFIAERNTASDEIMATYLPQKAASFMANKEDV
ncbi:sarcosine oxidase subunit delta [Kiloniella sp.]|uniref:sarcosine oxidase subunit delta n=1 Tax=Kiloniella sp. TaxID=1938587 RepID=UPI003B016807